MPIPIAVTLRATERPCDVGGVEVGAELEDGEFMGNFNRGRWLQKTVRWSGMQKDGVLAACWQRQIIVKKRNDWLPSTYFVQGYCGAG